MKIFHSVVAVSDSRIDSHSGEIIKKESHIEDFTSEDDAEKFLTGFIENLEHLYLLSREVDRLSDLYSQAIRKKYSKAETNRIYVDYEDAISRKNNFDEKINMEYAYYRPDYDQEFRIVKRFIYSV